MKTSKEKYQFTTWPDKSHFQTERLFINRTDIFPEYHLTDRSTLYYKHSYRDIYVNRTNPEDRIILEVINCASFAAAKEHLVTHLSRCANPKVPRLENCDEFYDIAFGTATEERIAAIVFLRGKVFFRVQHIGRVQDDIRPFLETLCREEQQN